MQATTSINEKSKIFNQFWQNIKAVVGPYWYPTEVSEKAFSDVIRSWGMLILLILLIIALVGVTVFNSFVNRYLVDIIIQEKNLTKFFDTLWLYGIALVLITLLVGFSKFVRKQIALDWYQWLNNQILSKGMIVTPDGHCRAFDARAQGTIFGSGAGIVVLKRLEDAMADGDHIYAVVKGSAVNNDGGTKVGYMAPNGDGQTAVVTQAMTVAGVDADTISYVEAHGTGTPLGDPIEIGGLTQGFRASTQSKNFCAIGSVKTNVGHLQIASGGGFYENSPVTVP
jgi:Beta-ketoacyl synthase, C-terminal domain/Beta-ketoacyl synthase, N-terminal domain